MQIFDKLLKNDRLTHTDQSTEKRIWPVERRSNLLNKNDDFVWVKPSSSLRRVHSKGTVVESAMKDVWGVSVDIVDILRAEWTGLDNSSDGSIAT